MMCFYPWHWQSVQLQKIGFERNKVSLGFEALARAQCLLRSKISLGKMALLSQIEESLEELAPACTLELLGMLHSLENAERRRGAIAALCELLRQGLDLTLLLAFSSKKTELVNKAKTICECLMASESIDLKFRRGLLLVSAWSGQSRPGS
ncbi:hypothetical protein OIU78_017222 [Salix suchowensis]|nr:hypothetical protein OIU78_017222 [Salix suchowensis]